MLSPGLTTRLFWHQSVGRAVSIAMAEDFIPNDVLEFLLAYIDSIVELEALLLLRSDADQTWTVTSMSKRLYIEESLCAAVLSHLEADGLCASTEGLYRYALSGTPEHETVGLLARTYAHYLIPVTNVIHGKPPRIQQFADAFRFRRGK